MPRPEDWSALGMHGDPTPGDPDALAGLQSALHDTEELGNELTSGLNRVLDKTGSGNGFVGKAAEALREKIDGHLKQFIDAIGQSFGHAADATSVYKSAVAEAQAKTEHALNAAQGLSKDDPQLAGLKDQAHAAQDDYNDAVRTYQHRLTEAEHMIRQPISGWQLFLKAIGILEIILAIVGAIFGGWIGLLAFGLGMVVFIGTLVEFAEGKAGILDVVLAFVGILFPSTKGINIGALAKGVFNALKNLPKSLSAGVTKLGGTLGHFLTSGITIKSIYSGVTALPGLVLRGLSGIANLAMKGVKITAAGLKMLANTFRTDFQVATAGISTTLGKVAVYPISFGGRFLLGAVLPVDFFELGVGFKGAFKMGFGTRLVTPTAHLSQSVLSGGLHVGALTGGHGGLTGLPTGASFNGLGNGGLQGLNPGGLHGLNTGIDAQLGGLHGLNLGTDIGGMNSGLTSLHSLNGGTQLDSVGTVMANAGGLDAIDHLAAFDHATGFQRTAAGLLEPLPTHLSGTNLAGGGLSEFGSSGLHALRGDLTPAGTGLSASFSDAMSSVRVATGHVEDFHTLGIPELRSIVDGDISAIKMTHDGISLQIGAQEGTPTTLHMDYRGSGLTNGEGKQVIVAPEVHEALGTADIMAAHGAGNGLQTPPPAATAGHVTTDVKTGAAATTPATADVKAGSVGTASVTADVKTGALGAHSPATDIKAAAVDVKTGAAGTAPVTVEAKAGAAVASPAVEVKTGSVGTSSVTTDVKTGSVGTSSVTTDVKTGSVGTSSVTTDVKTGSAGMSSVTADVKTGSAGAGSTGGVKTGSTTGQSVGGGIKKAVRDLDDLSGGTRSLNSPERLAEGPDTSSVTAQGDHLGVSAREDLDLLGRREGTGDTAGAAATTHVKTGPDAHLTGVERALDDGSGAVMLGEHVALRPTPTPVPKPRPNAAGGKPGPLSRFEAVSGGVTGKTGKERLAAWDEYEVASAKLAGARRELDLTGGQLGRPSENVDQAAAKLDVQQAEVALDIAEGKMSRLGMDAKTIEGHLDALGIPGPRPSRALDAPSTHGSGSVAKAGDDVRPAHVAETSSHNLTSQGVKEHSVTPDTAGHGTGPKSHEPPSVGRAVEALDDEFEVPASVGVDLGSHTSWKAARDGAVARPVWGRDWPDPVSHPGRAEPFSGPIRSNAHAPRYVVRAGFDVRTFRVDGHAVSDLTVRVNLSAAGRPAAEVDKLWERALSGVGDVFNRPGYLLPDGSVLHVTLERVDGVAGAHLTVKAGEMGSGANQYLWPLDASETDLAHEIGHQLGLKDEYRAADAGHRPDKVGTLMGDYLDGLTGGGMRGVYLHTIQGHLSDLAAAEHAFTTHVSLKPFDGVAPPGPGAKNKKAKAGKVPQPLTGAELTTKLTDPDRFGAGGDFKNVHDHYEFKPVAQYNGAGKGALKPGEDIRFVATVPAGLSDKKNFLLDLAKKYGESLGAKSGWDERLGLVIGLNGRAGSEGKILAKIEEFAEKWETEGTFSVSVTGFTWRQPDPKKITPGSGEQKEVPYGAIREAIIRDDLTRDMISKLKPVEGTGGQLYLHIGDADVQQLVVDGKPLFERAAGVIDDLKFTHDNAVHYPEAVSGGYKLPAGKTDKSLAGMKAADLDLAVRDGMGKIDAKAVYFPEPNTFVRLETSEFKGLEDAIHFGAIEKSKAGGKNHNAFKFEAQEGQHLLDNLIGQRKVAKADVWSAHPTKIVHFDSKLALVTDGGRIADKVTTDVKTFTSGLTQSHAHPNTWTKQIEHYLAVHHSHLDDPRGMLDMLSKVAFHDITMDGSLLKKIGGNQLLKALLSPDEIKVLQGNKQLAGLAINTRNALVDEINKINGHVTGGVAPAAPTGALHGADASAHVQGVAPNAPGRGARRANAAVPAPQPVVVHGELTELKDVTRFTPEFRSYAQHYELKPVAQYDGAVKGSLKPGEEIRFIATVAASVDEVKNVTKTSVGRAAENKLFDLAKKYEQALGADSGRGERLGLVIGVNGRPGTEGDILKAIREFRQKWDQEGTFSVSVTGFTWHQPDPALRAAGTQKEIPYGAIREAIVRDDLTRDMIGKVAGSDGAVYVHLGDFDVQRMTVGDKPLFDNATKVIHDMAVTKVSRTGQERVLLPEVVSGGYKLEDSAAATKAADLDLAVRDAMSGVDSRAVYFPEPNTFVRIDATDWGRLEDHVHFGLKQGDKWQFEAQEGKHLLKNVIDARKDGWGTDVSKMVRFSSDLALVTHGGRIARDLKGDLKSLMGGLTQSHADKKVWTDQVTDYLNTYHKGLLATNPDAARQLADLAFHDIHPTDHSKLVSMKVTELGEKNAKQWKGLRKGIPDDDTFRDLVKMAFHTRESLVTEINKINGHVAVDVTTDASSAVSHGAGSSAHGMPTRGHAVAPNAPSRGAGHANAAVPAPQPVVVHGELTELKDVTRFTPEFRSYAEHYSFKPVAQYDGAVKGSLKPGEEIRFIATVPATPGGKDKLFNLAKKYEQAFGADSGRSERLGLVIGVNGRPGTEGDILKAIREFRQKWDQEGTFSVSVTGFTWHQPDPALRAAGTQKEIPYGAIREAIVRDDLTREMVEKVAGSDGQVYLHLGDDDVKNMMVGGRPLFDSATTAIHEMRVTSDAAGGQTLFPEVVSGGYKLQDSVAATKAADLDLAVRDAMSKIDSRAVYFPEPNTFLRLDTEIYEGLEDQIHFGLKQGNKWQFEAQEGKHLLGNVMDARKDVWDTDVSKMVRFRSDLALVTDGGRIAKDLKSDLKSLMGGLTQSHADKKVWRDQVEQYLQLHHGDILRRNPQTAHQLADIAFHKIQTDGAKLESMSVKDIIGKDLAKWNELRDGVGSKETFRDLVNMALGTREVLVTEINKINKFAEEALAPPAPTAVSKVTVEEQQLDVLATTGVDLGSHVSWKAARDGAVPKTLKGRDWVDLVSHPGQANPFSGPIRSHADIPRYVVQAGFDVRTFRVDGHAVSDLTVRVHLSAGGRPTAEVDALWERALSGVGDVFNRPGYVLPDGSVLHVTLERTGVSQSAHLKVTVGELGAGANQRLWPLDASQTDLAHEIGHQLGLRDEYRAADAGHRPDNTGSLMGDYTDGLTGGGMRDRYLRLFQQHLDSLVDVDHALATYVPLKAFDGVAPPGPPKNKNKNKAPVPQPDPWTTHGDPGRFGTNSDFKQAYEYYDFKPVAQYDGTAKGALKPGEDIRFVATVPAGLSDKKNFLLDLAKKYGESFGAKSGWDERLGLVIGLNGRAGTESKILAKIQEFAEKWETEGTFSVSVTGFTWHQPDPKKVTVGQGEQKEVPYGAIREAIIRDDLTRDMIGKLKPVEEAHGQLYLHIGDADVQDFVVHGKPLFDRAVTSIEGAKFELKSDGSVHYPEAVSGGYKLPAGKTEKSLAGMKAADLDLSVRKAMATVDSRAIYFPEPNTFIRVDTAAFDTLDDGIHFGAVDKIKVGGKNHNAFSFEAQEGQHLLDNLIKSRQTSSKAWTENPSKMVRFDPGLALVTDGGRIADKMSADPKTLMSGLTQSHAHPGTWKKQMEHYLTVHHPGVADQNGMLDILSKMAFHQIVSDGTQLTRMNAAELVNKALSSAEVKLLKPHPELGRFAVRTRTALVDHLNALNGFGHGVAPSAPTAAPKAGAHLSDSAPAAGHEPRPHAGDESAGSLPDDAAHGPGQGPRDEAHELSPVDTGAPKPAGPSRSADTVTVSLDVDAARVTRSESAHGAVNDPSAVHGGNSQAGDGGKSLKGKKAPKEKKAPKDSLSKEQRGAQFAPKSAPDPRLRQLLTQNGYATGDQFGVAAALHNDPKLHVLLIRNARDNRDRSTDIRDFYLASGIDPSRVLVKDLVEGQQTKDLKMEQWQEINADVLPTVDADKMPRRKDFDNHLILPVGAATTFVGKHFSPELRETLRAAWKLDDGHFTPELQQAVGSWLNERGVPDVAGRDVVVLWTRFSGKRGEIHVEHDTSHTGVAQILDALHQRTTDRPQRPLVILAGDASAYSGRPGKFPAMAKQFRDAGLEVHDLTAFWKQPKGLDRWGGNTRIGQMRLFEYLNRASDGHLRHLGFRSGNLEAMALSGHQVRYLEEAGSNGGERMAKWHAVNGSTRTAADGLAPGYERIIIERPPTRSGQMVLEVKAEKLKKEELYKGKQIPDDVKADIKDLTDKFEHPSWVPGGDRPYVRNIKEVKDHHIKGFDLRDVTKVVDYLTAPHSVEVPGTGHHVPSSGHTDAPAADHSVAPESSGPEHGSLSDDAVREVPDVPDPLPAASAQPSGVGGKAPDTPPSPQPAAESAPQAPVRMTANGQIGGADRVLPSQETTTTVTRDLVAHFEGVLTPDQRDTLRADLQTQLSREVWPSLSAMTRGEPRTLTMDVAGFSGDITVRAKVTKAETDGAFKSLEFEDGSESLVRDGFQRETRSVVTAGVLVKGKAAAYTDLTGYLSSNWSRSEAHRMVSSGRLFSRTKTPEPALKLDVEVRLEFDFSAVRGTFGKHLPLGTVDGGRVSRVEVPAKVPVASAEADVRPPSGMQHYLPPARIEQTLALGGMDTVRDLFLVNADGERVSGTLHKALLGSLDDPDSLESYGKRAFGDGWPRVRELVLDRLGSLDSLQYRLKGMTAGQTLEIDLGPDAGSLLVNAEISSMKHLRNTEKTEFNTGSDVTRVYTHTKSSEHGVRATMNVQSADLHAGPTTVTGVGQGEFEREGAVIGQQAVRTGTAVKMKVPGAVFDGVTTLSFVHRADPLGAATAPVPGAQVAAHSAVLDAARDATSAAHDATPTTGHGTTVVAGADSAHVATTTPHGASPDAPGGTVRPVRGGRAQLGFQVLVDAADARPVSEPGSFSAATRPQGPRRTEAPALREGDHAWQPSAAVWHDGLPSRTVVIDVLAGEERAVGAPQLPRLNDLVDGIGRDYFGPDWADARPAAQDMATREQLAATLPQMTRGTTARSAPLPMPLRSNAQFALNGRLESLEFVRTLDAAEINLLSDVADELGGRLGSGFGHGQLAQGGIQPELAGDFTLALHAPGGGTAHRYRSGNGVSGGQSSVAGAKYPEPMALYIATAGIDAHVGRVGETAAHGGSTDVRFVVAIPKSHTQRYEVTKEAAGTQTFHRPASVTEPAPTPATTAARTDLTVQPPLRVTGSGRIGNGDVVVELPGDVVVKELKQQLSGTFGERWDQVEGEVSRFFDSIALQPRTAGLTGGDTWGGTFRAGPVTADIHITAADAKMTEHVRVEENFEFEQGTESVTAAAVQKDTHVRRTLWERAGFKTPHVSFTLGHVHHKESVDGHSVDVRGGVVSKNKTVEPAALFKGQVTYTVQVKVSHALPGRGGERTFTVTGDGQFAFPVRDLPADPATGAAHQVDQHYRVPERIARSLRLGAEDIVLDTRPARADAAGGAPAADLVEDVLRQLDPSGPKVFGSVADWQVARAKLMERLPASEFQRRLRSMMSGQPWVIRVNGRELAISASVKEMNHTANTKATEFNSATVDIAGGSRTEPGLSGPQITSDGTNVTVVGTSDPIGASPAEVFGGGTLAHTVQVEHLADSSSGIRSAVGTKTKVPGSVFEGVARLHFEFRDRWRPFGRAVDTRVSKDAVKAQTVFDELRDKIADLDQQVKALETVRPGDVPETSGAGVATRDPQAGAGDEVRAGDPAAGPAGGSTGVPKSEVDMLKDELAAAKADFEAHLVKQSADIKTALDTRRTGRGPLAFSSMTKRTFGVRVRRVGEAEIGFQALLPSADAVKVSRAEDALFKAPEPGVGRPQPPKHPGQEPQRVEMPKPPESLLTDGMSGGHLVRDLPDVQSLRGLLDSEGGRAFGSAWSDATRAGTPRSERVMGEFTKDRLMAELPQLTRGGELKSETFRVNGREAWVSAKAEIVGLTHVRPEPKAEVALAGERFSLFTRRGQHSRQFFLLGQVGAVTSALENKLGAALTFGGGLRRRTRGDQVTGGRTFTNAKIPTPLEHYDGHVKFTFTFHHGGTDTEVSGVVLAGVSVPSSEITEHVVVKQGHVFTRPEIPDHEPTTTPGTGQAVDPADATPDVPERLGSEGPVPSASTGPDRSLPEASANGVRLSTLLEVPEPAEETVTHGVPHMSSTDLTTPKGTSAHQNPPAETSAHTSVREEASAHTSVREEASVPTSLHEGSSVQTSSHEEAPAPAPAHEEALTPPPAHEDAPAHAEPSPHPGAHAADAHTSAGTPHTDAPRADKGKGRAEAAVDEDEAIEAGAALTEARRLRAEAERVRSLMDGRRTGGVGGAADGDGTRLAHADEQLEAARAAETLAEAHWSEVTHGRPLPFAVKREGPIPGLGGGAPHWSRPSKSGRGSASASAAPPAPEGTVVSVDHIPSASHVVFDTEDGEGYALVPSGPDLMVARWVSDPASAHGRPADPATGQKAYEGDIAVQQELLAKALTAAEDTPQLKKVLQRQLMSFEEDVRLLRILEDRKALRNLEPAQLVAVVLAERRALRTLSADRDRLTANLLGGKRDWRWARAYPFDEQNVDRFIQRVQRHLLEDLSLTVNVDLGARVGDGTLLDSMTRDERLLRNVWEVVPGYTRYFERRGAAEETMGYPASVKRTTHASGIYRPEPGPDAWDESFAPTPADRADLPNYAALTSTYRPRGLEGYGKAVFHLRHDLMQRATFTPLDSFFPGRQGARSITGSGNMLPLLNHGSQPLVRLAFAEATDFRYDEELRLLRDAGDLESQLVGFFEAQLHGGVSWKDVERVVLVQEGGTPAHQQKLQLERFAHAEGLGFTVEILEPGAVRTAALPSGAPVGDDTLVSAHTGGTEPVDVFAAHTSPAESTAVRGMVEDGTHVTVEEGTVPVRTPEPPELTHPTPAEAFDAVRQRFPDPLVRTGRWTMWGHDGDTPHTSAYAIENGALGLRGVFVPPAADGHLGAWHWHLPGETRPVAVTPLTLPTSSTPNGATATPWRIAADSADHIASALEGTPWSAGLHWRADDEELYVFGPAGPERPAAVFADGLRPGGATLVHVAAHVSDDGVPDSVWLTATRKIGWLRERAAAGNAAAIDLLDHYGWRYDVAAPGGVDVNDTLDLAGPHPERAEVLYPGGVDSRYIRGAQRLEGGRPVGPYLTNPGFVEPGADRTPTEGTEK
ncbi:hypothetical protein [Streptomyces sp. NPDC001315]|uniref:scabin-related ADP-ribosyltransferase n=1 Tax=Streptomyces sp. NPDC001315 TaxID=3364562 RepID=UPI0036C25DDC